MQRRAIAMMQEFREHLDRENLPTIGIALAARSLSIPVVLSFSVEIDGRLPTGQSLQEAIEATDAATDRHPAYYMINCAFPTHVLTGLGRCV